MKTTLKQDASKIFFDNFIQQPLLQSLYSGKNSSGTHHVQNAPHDTTLQIGTQVRDLYDLRHRFFAITNSQNIAQCLGLIDDDLRSARF